MQPKDKIIKTYNKVAAKYAATYFDELDRKPLDRLLLSSFYKENKHKGIFIDLGCGPGQTTKFLADCGCTEIIGTDLSPEMIAVAKRTNPSLNFEIADMLALKYPDNNFGAAIAFYSIVNLDYPTIELAFKEINRVLKNNGQFLLCFHTGNEEVHLDKMLDEDVDIDFYFLDTDRIISLLKNAGFNIIETFVRYPYETEHPTKRAYITAQTVSLKQIQQLP